jgi:hypothetical protein
MSIPTKSTVPVGGHECIYIEDISEIGSLWLCIFCGRYKDTPSPLPYISNDLPVIRRLAIIDGIHDKKGEAIHKIIIPVTVHRRGLSTPNNPDTTLVDVTITYKQANERQQKWGGKVSVLAIDGVEDVVFMLAQGHKKKMILWLLYKEFLAVLGLSHGQVAKARKAFGIQSDYDI